MSLPCASPNKPNKLPRLRGGGRARSVRAHVERRHAHGESPVRARDVDGGAAVSGENELAGRVDRPTLLVVDDQAANLHAMFQMFKSDYRVLMATSGWQAIKVCRSALPDLILLDVLMPGMDGYDVCRNLKRNKNTAHIPVIFVTASDNPEEEANCLNVGGVDFISKPVNPMVVRSRVATHITLKQQADRLRQSSQELNSALRLGRVGSWSWSLVGDAATCTSQLCEVLGIGEGRDLPAGEAKARFQPASWFKFLRAIVRAKRGFSTHGAELEHVRQGDTAGWVLSNVEPVLSARGEVVAIRGTAVDISANKQIDQMRAAKELAEMANQHKTRFLSSMSHELRTPLNAVLGFAQILSFSSIVQQTPSLQGHVSHILDAGRHLLDMVNDLLDLASIESGKMDLHVAVLDLGKVVQACVDIIAVEAAGRGLTVRVLSSQQSVGALADDRRLRQILLNLLSNAVKYNTAHGCVTVAVDTGDGLARVSVTDTGPGLSNVQLASLFKPFNRLGAENSNVPGTGIGLVLAQRMAKAMAGSIECESLLGKGTTFTLALPEASVLN